MGASAEIARQSNAVVHDHAGVIRAAARTGYAARGVLYSVIGLLAVFVAFGRGRGEADKTGALHEIGSQPLGRTMLIVLAAAFAAYALWLFVEAGLNFERHGAWGRLGRALRGVVYASLTWATVDYAITSNSTGGDQQSRDLTARLLSWEWGAWLVAGIGLTMIGVGLHSGRQATGERFMKRLKVYEASPESAVAIRVVARVGLWARMVVFSLVGVFFIRAALTHDSKAATGLDGALRRVAELPYGRALLGVLAVGLIAFGCYSFAEARYRTINTT